MDVIIIDCGFGNINSISKCIENIGFKQKVITDPNDLEDAKKIIFPGVGSFSNAMNTVHSNNWYKILRKKITDDKVPFLGICIGMQVLANIGYEFQETRGLELIDGKIKKIDEKKCNLSIPHIGWNNLEIKIKNRLFSKIKNDTDFYFDHSYNLCDGNSDEIIATTNHAFDIVAAVNKGNIYGVQFHPEKSSDGGKQLLKNFLEI